MLSRDMARYVDLRRSLGFRFRVQHSFLRNFVAFAEARGDDFVRIDRVLDWAARAPSPASCRIRLLTVRRFALAMQAEDIRYEVPAADAVGRATFQRRSPHIYRAEEITELMRVAAQLKPVGSIRPLMYATLFGLLAATGMRISEALALLLGDVTTDGLIIRNTKFRKSRLLPLHDTTRQMLDDYLSARLRLGTLDGALFVSTTGKAPSYSTVESIFLKLMRTIGVRGEPSQPGPRIHDLRQNAESRKMPSDAAWALILASFRHRALGIISVALQGVQRPQKLIGRAAASQFTVRRRHFGERRLLRARQTCR